jgi:hypothetical protein
MKKAEINRLLALPAEQRLELAELLTRSCAHGDDIRLVPVQDHADQCVAELLESLAVESREGECCREIQI